MEQIFPTFDVDASEMNNKVNGYLEAAKEEFDNCLLIENPTWEAMDKFENLKDELSRYLSEVSHLKSVLNTPELVEAYNSCIPMITNFGAYIVQNENYYNYLNRLDKQTLNPIQLRLLNKSIEEFKNSGFGLPPEEKERLNKISEKQSTLSQIFMSNLNASRDAWSLNVLTKEELQGVLPHDLERFKRVAENKGQDGYTLSLATDYLSILTDCENREIRKKMYLGYNRVATKYAEGNYDNTPIMNEILSLRQEKAVLLGFANFGELSLRNKMAESPEKVIDFLEDLTEKSRKSYSEDMDELLALALELGIKDFNLWDQFHIVKKYQERKYSINLSSVTDYFPMEKVLTGLYTFVDDMFGFQIKEIEAPHKYIDDLRLLELSKDGVPTGYIYCDLMARERKKSGAWMNNYIGKEYNSLPIAFITCNFPESKPQLIKLSNVVTLFHEFGHALHHTLSEVCESGAFGLAGVAWDVVELPSTFMEFFVLDPNVLPNISGHYETGECLPSDVVEALKSMKSSLSSLTMMRQMEFSLVDMKAHMGNNIEMDALGDEFRAKNGLTKLNQDISFYNQFAHIFAGGYAAGYYSYKWANILASDLFESFEEKGGMNSDLGRHYLKTLLSKGGSKDMLDLFIDFKGREPSPDAFLRHNGIEVLK